MEPSPETRRLARQATWLVGGTTAYNVVEGGVATWAALQAGSIALLGFGLDSLIEIAAGGFMLWRLRVEMTSEDSAYVETAERRVRRVIGLTFLALAIYVTVEAVLTLTSQAKPEASLVGIVLTSLSLLIMPTIAVAKLRVAHKMGSGALRAEAKETLACAFLSLTLLLGLVLNAVAGWWWADPVAALVIVPWLAREGVEGLRGEAEEED